MGDGRELIQRARAIASGKRADAPISSRLAAMVTGGSNRAHLVLTHVGRPNGNGHLLTVAEAERLVSKEPSFRVTMTRDEAKTALEKHRVSAYETVGKAIAWDLVQGPDGRMRIEYVAQFYDTTDFARHAFKLVEDKLYRHNSFDIRYGPVECSACGKRFTKNQDKCRHLAVKNGMVVGTERAHVIMHNPTVTGAALLDGPGGDKDAVVLATATLVESKEEPQMANEQTPQTKDDKQIAQAARQEEVDQLNAKVAELEKKLSAQAEELTTANEQLATYKRAERQARVSSIVDAQVARGRSFADDAAKAAAVERLCAQTDEQLVAAEEAINALPAPDADKNEPSAGQSTADTPPPAPSAAQKAQAADQGNANKPAAVADPDGSGDAKTAIDNFIAARNQRRG